MNRLRAQRGVALITAMLIAALVGTVAISLAWQSTLDIRRTMVQLHRDQAVQIAFGAESWVQTILSQDLADSQTDHLGEIWATELPGLPIEGGEVFGKVEDLQGRFNINNLVDANGEVDQEALEQFQRLLAALGLDVRFAGIAADWLDSNVDGSFPDGAEDPEYSTKIPPYRAANRQIADVSELAAIEGMDKATMDVLLPHVVALPGGTGINVNTATPAVLQSLDENISVSDVEALIGERGETGFTDVVNTFTTLVQPDVLNQLEESSEFFQLKVSVRIDNVRISYTSTYQRYPQGDVAPILRSFGSL